MGQADAGAPPALIGPLPPAPGVYRFRDQRASVLYIGRAVNLRRRVASYWGGLRVRLAVSALHRVMPVAYAVDGLRGWNRDMARTRGIGPSDRAVLTEALTAVLERDADAVAWFRAELVRRRDSAVAELAFERAARLQEEIRAAEWVTSEQKVTQATPGDFGVHGWAMKGEGGGRRHGGYWSASRSKPAGSGPGGSDRAGERWQIRSWPPRPPHGCRSPSATPSWPPSLTAPARVRRNNVAHGQRVLGSTA